MFSWLVCRVCFDPAGPFHLRMLGSHDRREGRSDCEAVVLESYSPMESNPSPKKRLAMTSLRIVCGLEELAMHSRSGLTHVLSILDPNYPRPEVFSAFDEHAKLELRFHDAIEPKRGVRLSREKDVAAILEFGERLHAEPNQGQRVVLVHCHAGISRSTAAMAMLIAQAHPELDEEGVFERLIAIRPRAWPNSRMVGYADDLLRRNGRLIEALAGLYRAQIPRIPGIAEYMRDNGRRREYEMAGQTRPSVEPSRADAGRSPAAGKGSGRARKGKEWVGKGKEGNGRGGSGRGRGRKGQGQGI
jgi:predicted protein tyrosine phosphatase